MTKAGNLTEIVYEGSIFTIESYTNTSGKNLTIDWLEQLNISYQAKFAALFARLGDHGKIFNERKFKHLTETEQLFEFKIDSSRIICFFFVGQRVILAHGFNKKGDKTPKTEIERAHRIKHEFEQRTKYEKK
ncbi:MAG: type II toxin-antitoxin system RelE/ParE family toxin [Oligoflexia bacterium]|nr:type II toxin-antitoxin system RelE/ParE family toxin [Oligoflexia bacterium]